MIVEQPYLLFLGDAEDALMAKTAYGIRDWRPEACAGQLRLPGCRADLGIPDLTIEAARAAGVRTLVIGVANAGGVLPDHWVDQLVAAARAGLDIASGLHRRLTSIPELVAAARQAGRQLHDVRYTDQGFATGTGVRRTGRRLLTVGTDCSIGKKYTALALERAMRARGYDVDFRATGQTGILISGRGVAIDAVIADFIAGTAEWLSPAQAPGHWDIIEGQGSLFHPSFAGVTLGLLHGSQPDVVVVCHEPTRTTMRGVAAPMPSIGDVIAQTLRLGQRTNPGICCIGIAVNTAALASEAAADCLSRLAAEHGIPAVDPVRHGVEPLVDALVERFPAPTDGDPA